jgi:Do/DeqQ family serine protease
MFMAKNKKFWKIFSSTLAALVVLLRGFLVQALVISGLVISACSQAQDKSMTDQSLRPGVADMLERVTPAVVNIAVVGEVEVQQNPLLSDPRLRRYFNMPNAPDQPETRETAAVGSGVIINADQGYVVTNAHVVKDAKRVDVILQDRRRFESAEVLGIDPQTDIALLKIPAENLHELPIADSTTLRVGDSVLAIGNPFGLGQTVTTGLISALGRTGLDRENYEDFIQTDASINPGNSGGALVDYNGELVGINSAIIAPSGGNVGIGFAVPINMAMAVVQQIVDYGDVQRGLLGVQISDLTPDLAEALNLPIDAGALVQAVSPDSAASDAGIEAGDVIVAVNEIQVDSGSGLRNAIGLTRAGTEVEITFYRDQDRQTVSATISGVQTVAQTSPEILDNGLLEGVQLAPSNVKGVLVQNVEQNSRAFAYGLRNEDIITAVNRNPVNSVSVLQELLAASTSSAVALTVIRENQQMLVIIRR